MTKKIENKRLPRNFHKTFKPERQYINAMLRYAASGKSGDSQTISSSTGIPTGVSSGKVPAILDYCRGMGLIRLAVGSEHSAIKHPELTSFGRIVLLDDPFLKCSISQWIAHFNLCSPLSGADVWCHTFFWGAQTLSRTFSREQLESHLSLIYGIRKSGLIGPLIGMYEDQASFKLCGALSESGREITRRSAPITEELGRGYGAWLLQMIADHFPKQEQVSLTNLDKVAGWKTIPGWTISSFFDLLELLERKALISVDRQMEPWLIQPKISVDEAWRNIYIDMI
jgi:hypothetical protein